MFMWMLQRLHTHHGRTDAIGFNRRGGKVGPVWTAGGTGSHYMLSASTINGEMDALYNRMNPSGPYDWNWAKASATSSNPLRRWTMSFRSSSSAPSQAAFR